MVVRAFRESDDTPSTKESVKEAQAQLNATFEEAVAKAQAYWDKSEQKPTLIAIGSFALLALYFTNSIVSAVDRLPLISTVFELIGLAYSGFTAYKFFLVPGEKEALTDSAKGFVKKVGIDL